MSVTTHVIRAIAMRFCVSDLCCAAVFVCLEARLLVQSNGLPTGTFHDCCILPELFTAVCCWAYAGSSAKGLPGRLGAAGTLAVTVWAGAWLLLGRSSIYAIQGGIAVRDYFPLIVGLAAAWSRLAAVGDIA